MGLYKGLYLSADRVSVDYIHKLQVEGSLVANIKNFFEEIPEAYRGGYYPWFLNYTYLFDKKHTQKEGLEKLVTTFYDRSRIYLTAEDRDVDPRDLQPDAKREAYHFLVAILHATSPNPIQRNWYVFGFCTCRDERGERSLGGLYRRLLLGHELFSDVPDHGSLVSQKKLKTATFEGFWHAHESGTLIKLIDSKGIKAQRMGFPFLAQFLSIPPNGPRPNVWDLKQYLAIDEPIEHPPSLTLEVDYGFRNCQTFEETCILREIYKRLLLKADLLELHEACRKGRLFEFAVEFDKIDSDHKRLMKSIYSS